MKRPSCAPEHVREKTAERGWFREQLWLIESILNGRWSYWQAILLNGSIGEGQDWQIPQLNFTAHFQGTQPGCGKSGELAATESGRDLLQQVGGPAEARSHVLKVFTEALDHGCNSLGKLVDWWLWAFGCSAIEERPNISDRGAVAMYSKLELHRMIGNPSDWGSAINLEIMGRGTKGTAWFPTPMNVAQMMARMTFDGIPDARLKSCVDPCVGTGVFPLVASNYTLNIRGTDIDPLMVSWCRFAGYLFVPWMVFGNKRFIREFRECDENKSVEVEMVSATEAQEPEPIMVGGTQGRLF